MFACRWRLVRDRHMFYKLRRITGKAFNPVRGDVGVGIIGLALILYGVVAGLRDKLSPKARAWVVGTGFLLCAFDVVREDRRLAERCRAGSFDACVRIQKREVAASARR